MTHHQIVYLRIRAELLFATQAVESMAADRTCRVVRRRLLATCREFAEGEYPAVAGWWAANLAPGCVYRGEPIPFPDEFS